MANRFNKFLWKRSNVAGKVPTAGDLLLGEMALNVADVKLYASGTTANQILPIGWDRVARTGDTMTGTLYAPSISATTISATSVDINGTFKYVDTNQSAGKILTSDANGNATWQPQLVGGGAAFFLTNTTSDVGVYKDTDPNIQNGPLQTITNLNCTNGQLLASWITLSGTPGLTYYPAGIVNLHIHAASTDSGGKDTRLYFEIYKRTTGGTETLISTSSYSELLTLTNSENSVDNTIPSFTANTSDRLVVKVYAYIVGGGNAPDVDLYVENGTASRFEIPSITVSTANFVPYTGATKDVYLNTNSITANGVFSSDGISATGGITGSSVSATTYYNLPTDIRVTGGTYSNGTALFTNNSGGTFSVTGFTTGSTDTFVTGGTITTGGTLELTRNDAVSVSIDLTETKRLVINNGFPISAGEAYLGTSGAKFYSFDGTGGSDDEASYNFSVPTDYISGGTFYIKFVTTATANVIQFEMNITSRDNGGDMSTPTDTAIQNATSGSTTSWDMVETAVYTPSGSTFSKDKNVAIKINRDASDAPDTFGGTAYVWGIVFEYTGIK